MPFFAEQALERESEGYLGPIGPRSARAREEAGAAFNVSGATVERARRVQEGSPELFEEVKSFLALANSPLTA